MKLATVHIVDDDEPLRAALSRLLKVEGYEVRTYASAGEFLLSPPEEGPGCLVLDVWMPGPSGLELQHAFEHRAGALPIVFLTAHADVPSTVRAMKAGAVDFLTKPVEPEALLQAIAVAVARDSTVRTRREAVAAVQGRYATLTDRERAVYDRVVAGRLNKQIASELGITESTVKAHRAQVMEKMGVDSLADLVRTADLICADGAQAVP